MDYQQTSTEFVRRLIVSLRVLFWNRKFPRVQIVTIEEMLGGKRPDMPWGKAPFAKAPTEKERAQQETLL